MTTPGLGQWALGACGAGASLPAYFLHQGPYKHYYGGQPPSPRAFADDASAVCIAGRRRRDHQFSQPLAAHPPGCGRAHPRCRRWRAGPARVEPALLAAPPHLPIEFLEEYQHLPQATQHPIVIVMLTSSLHPRDVQRVAQLRIVADFISKPLTTEKVRELWQAHFPAAPTA
jgi:hypothetical protein